MATTKKSATKKASAKKKASVKKVSTTPAVSRKPPEPPETPKLITSYLAPSRLDVGYHAIRLELVYAYEKSRTRVVVKLHMVDADQLTYLQLLGPISHAVIMIRSRPEEMYRAQRERCVIVVEAANWFSTSYDMRQDVIDSIKKHWSPAPDWAEEHPEGLRLMVAAVQIPDPLYFVPTKETE